MTATPKNTTEPRISDFLSINALREILESFSVLSGFEAEVVDSDGQCVVQATPDQQVQQQIEQMHHATSGTQQDLSAPIVVDGNMVGAVKLTPQDDHHTSEQEMKKWLELAEQFNLAPDCRDAFVQSARVLADEKRKQATHLLYLFSAAIGRFCAQGQQLRQRMQEITLLYTALTLLAGQKDLQQILDTIAQTAAQVMNCKAASIRLIGEDGNELTVRAAYKLSADYLNKGLILIEKSLIDQMALQQGIVYVADMANDPRTLYPEDARREGISSILVAGMVFRGKPVGVMRVYTDKPRSFSDHEQALLQSMAQLSAVAIENARLEAIRAESARVQRQVELAADVQRRLMPNNLLTIGPINVAGRYEPSFELGGDFFDFLPLESSVGIAVGDVVGKGVAASLLMAMLRGALHAYVEDVFDLDQIISRVNHSFTRDTRDNEFATLFYGTLDTTTLRLTYCSAGHDPAYLLRDGQFITLSDGGMALGIDRRAQYSKGLIDLQPHDVLLVYSDGVPDAMNFNLQKFGRKRLKQALRDAAQWPVERIVNHVLWEVRRFAGLHRIADDMTLVGVKVEDVVDAAEQTNPD